VSEREEIRVAALAEPISHYTDAPRAGNLLFVSGCVAAQARQVSANIDAVR
jgi:enamine deaminase RidA (YjgF/YER057c/UK114 family)